MISNDQAQQFIRALLRQPTKVVAQTKQEDPLGIFEKVPRATYGRQLSDQKNPDGKFNRGISGSPYIDSGTGAGNSSDGDGDSAKTTPYTGGSGTGSPDNPPTSD